MIVTSTHFPQKHVNNFTVKTELNIIHHLKRKYIITLNIYTHLKDIVT